MNFSLLSPARSATKDREGKPETIVVVECDSIRERKEREFVHLALPFTDGSVSNCVKCSCFLGLNEPWTDSADLYSRHPARCTS